MGKLPFRRLFAYTLGVAFVASACGFAACMAAPSLHVDQLGAGFFATGSMLLFLGFFLMRWWIRLSRAAGVPQMVTSKRNAALYGGLLVLILVGGTALAYFVYATTGSRLAEAGTSLFLVAPAAFVVARASYAHMKAPVSQEAPSLRVTAIVQPFLAAIFTVNLVLQLGTRHVEGDLRVLHDANIAGFLILIPIMPIGTYFLWQRYVRARETAATLAS
jgi:hypothetical protein